MELMYSALPNSWRTALESEFEKDYFKKLTTQIMAERTRHTVFPPEELVFNALVQTPLEAVKAVILGQDPYHGDGQAHGLSFSVQHGVRIPPSLRNIHSELMNDLHILPPNHGNLESWAKNGVLLLNAMLTVRKAEPGSHQHLGWQVFTDQIIKTVSDQTENTAFILWGNFAKSKKELINQEKHLIIESAHPSPFSANKGFLGSKPFSKVNSYLTEHGKTPINWQLG